MTYYDVIAFLEEHIFGRGTEEQHTCAYEEHIVRSLVQRAHSVHSYPGEVNAFSEQQGARFRPQLHQRVLFGKVKCGVGQL